MPKENTHLYFADDVVPALPDEIRRRISAHPDAYRLGSVFTDTFYYTGHARIADILHGWDGSHTGEIVFAMLDGSSSGGDLCFTLGYLTHCALDMVFHPVLYYLSGNYYDEDPVRRKRAVAAHRRLETRLDSAIGNRRRIHRELRTSIVAGLSVARVFEARFTVGFVDIRRALGRQIFFNRLFASATAYRLLRALRFFGMVPDEGQEWLFYAADAGAKPWPIDTTIAYRDLVNGEKRSTTVADLWQLARHRAVEMIQAAFEYSRGGLSSDNIRCALPGESLDTGLPGVPVSAIRHTAVDGYE